MRKNGNEDAFEVGLVSGTIMVRSAGDEPSISFIESVEGVRLGYPTTAVASRVEGQAFLTRARHESVPGTSGRLRRKIRTSADEEANGHQSALSFYEIDVDLAKARDPVQTLFLSGELG
jgi:hypothetical protein